MYIPNSGWAIVVAGNEVIGQIKNVKEELIFEEEFQEVLREDFEEKIEVEYQDEKLPDNVVRIEDYFFREEE